MADYRRGMLIAIILSVALSGSTLVDEADERNLVYTQCLFAQVRAARENSLPTRAMLDHVESQCRQERQALEAAIIAVRLERGETRAEAQANWDRVHANSIDAVRRAYELRLAEQPG